MVKIIRELNSLPKDFAVEFPHLTDLLFLCRIFSQHLIATRSCADVLAQFEGSVEDCTEYIPLLYVRSVIDALTTIPLVTDTYELHLEMVKNLVVLCSSQVWLKIVSFLISIALYSFGRWSTSISWTFFLERYSSICSSTHSSTCPWVRITK